MSRKDWIPNWIPNKSFASIVLGGSLLDYKKSMNAHKIIDKDVVTGQATYEVLGADVSFEVEGNNVVAVSIHDCCMYKGKNLIGMNVIELEDALGSEPNEIGKSVVFDDGDIRTPIEYDDLGLIAWFSNNVAVHICVYNSH